MPITPGTGGQKGPGISQRGHLQDDPGQFQRGIPGRGALWFSIANL
jgi:hypothetical protein